VNRPLDTIRLSQKAKDQLIKLKRNTGLMQWNVLCRWAFCLSLAEESVPPSARIPADSSVEMTWKVFGGKYEALYLALLRQRCHKDGLGLDDETLATQFRLHLHRGIGYLAADRDIRSLGDLMRKIVE
jgi:DNA sulfur modification protein DndE